MILNRGGNNMPMKEPKSSVCQSCGMPVTKKEDFGTNMDRSKNEDYCHFCFQRGSYTQPNLTLQQMINTTSGYISVRLKTTKEEGLATAKQLIPTLKRWQGRQ